MAKEKSLPGLKSRIVGYKNGRIAKRMIRFERWLIVIKLRNKVKICAKRLILWAAGENGRIL
ncbi:hypothetical protein D5281_08820 [bacterium 1xD42-62]|uniref:Uncharacterized protein n=1 Tax=Parablautia muri TaxID=2320879 RepID=A0A9X5GQZ6_9FIRM|nr:hypothetical protein [Parablautia muri]